MRRLSESRANIGRLNADGTLDGNFNPGADNAINSLALQTDGKILAGGAFITLGGGGLYRIGRLNADGTLDTSFNPLASNIVYSVALQADSKILVGGLFTGLSGQIRTNIGRFNADGTLDTSFNPGITNRSGSVYSLAVETDGGILVGGAFTGLGGQSCTNIGRLNADGTLDTTFNAGASNTVYSLALQADGRILAGGTFAGLGGQGRSYLGRLTPTVPAIQSLTFDGSTINWQRSGSSPEVWRTTFDAATNGKSWTTLGAGIRVTGGWQLTGLTWPTNASLRARGFVVGGEYNGSGWFVETMTGPPFITNQPVNQTVSVGGTATFTVQADGTTTLGYQWSFNRTNISWATNTTLTLTNVQPYQAGNYAVLVTNVFGSIVSSNATLTVTLDHLTWNQIPSPQFVNTPIAVTIQASDAANGLFTNFTGTVLLASTNGVAVNPPVSGNFVQGVWTGALVIVQPVTNLVLTAGDGLGHIGLANSINVIGLPPLMTTISGSTLYMFWPTNPAGFVLETSPDLSPGSWIPVAAPPIPTNNQYYQQVQASGTNAFYRLRFPGP